MIDQIGMVSLDTLSPSDLRGKTIFIRVDFNVPLIPRDRAYYRVADDTRIRRFLDLTFSKIHELTEGDCRIIIGSHLGRPHKKKDHVGWDGIFNIQFVSSHFDTLIRKIYGDTYTIFPPEIIDSHLKNSLEIVLHKRLPTGAIKFLPNLRYLLEPKNTETYREEFIEELATVSDVYINCAFGCSHRITRSIKRLPQLMRKEGKLVVAGNLLYEEIMRLGEMGRRITKHPRRTSVVAGGAKISDKIGILKQFVKTQVKMIFIGGKMVNAFFVARKHRSRLDSFGIEDIPKKLLKSNEEDNRNFIREVQLAGEVMELAKSNRVELCLPEDFKVVRNYQDTEFEIKSVPDLDSELQLDLGPKTIANYSRTILQSGIENVFWNGPLGAYDHPHTDSYAQGSVELAKLIFSTALTDENLSSVIGGGDSAAILNRVTGPDLKKLIKRQIEKQFLPSINRNLLTLDFVENDSYKLWNYLSSNFFVSTGGGAALEFLEKFLSDEGKSDLASYLPGTATLMELCSISVPGESQAANF